MRFFFDQDGVPVAFTDTLHGEPVVLLHCSASSSRQWRAVIGEPEAAQGYRWVALDLYGYGQTGFPRRTCPFGLDQEVALVGRLLEILGQPAHLVGHSYGGAVAFAAAVRYPQLVRSVYAHEPVLFRLLLQDGKLAEWEEITGLSSRFRAAFAAGQVEDAVALFIDYWGGDGAFHALPLRRRQEIIRRAPKIALDFEALFHLPLTQHDVVACRLPALVTVGAVTPAPAGQVAVLLGRALGSGGLRVLEDADHMAPLTTPQRIRQILLEHIRSSCVK